MSELSPAARLVLDGIREALADPTALDEIRAALAVKPTSPSPTLYTAETLAAELGVHARTIRRHISSGALAASKRGDRWVITAEAAREWASGGPRTRLTATRQGVRRSDTTNALARGFKKAGR